MVKTAGDEVNLTGRLQGRARFCFAALGTLSLLVLVSWATATWRLGTLGEGYIPMAPSTSAAFLVLAAAAWLWQARPHSKLATQFARVVALSLLIVSALVCLRWEFGLQPTTPPAGVPEAEASYPLGRMSPLTAIAFVLVTLALLLQLGNGRAGKTPRQIAAILAVILLFLSAGVGLSYVLGAPLFYGGTLIPMAALTAAAFALMSLGLMMLTGADTWPLGLFVHEAEAGRSRRFTWGIAALALAVLLAVGGIAYDYLRREREQARALAMQTVTAVADLKVGQIAWWYGERVADARVITDIPLQAALQKFLTDPADPAARSRMVTWLQAMDREYDYSITALVDGRGRVLLSARPQATPLEPHELQGVRRALTTGTIAVHDLHSEGDGEVVYLSLIVPLSRDPSCALLLQVDASRFLLPLVEKWPTPSRTAETLLVRREGNEVVFLSHLRHRKGAPLSMRLPIDLRKGLPAARAASGEEGIFEGTDYRGVQVVASLRSIPGTPWAMVAKLDEAEIYAPFLRATSTTLLFVAALLLAVLSGMSVLWYRRGMASAERELVLLNAGQRAEQELDLAYRALRDREHLLSEMGRIAQVGGWEFDPRSGQGTWTAEVARIHGLDPDEPTSMERGLSFYQGESRATIELALKEAIELGLDYDLQLELVTAGGARKWIQTIGHATVENGTTTRVSGSFQDITERKRVEEQIRQLNDELEHRVLERTSQLELANRELEAFSYSVSHDLRAPMRGIDGWSVALLEDYGPVLDERGREYLAKVRSETLHMSQLIDDMLALSRVTRQEMRLAPLDLSVAASIIAAQLREKEPSRVVEFVIQEGLEARVDAGLMGAALWNLLDNAWKFTSKQAAARIEFGRIEERQPPVYFVRDNGAGFDMKYASKLFSPFQRLHRSSEFPGTGIGLATVQRVISRHGGKIWAEAETGRGATFFFTLEAPS